MRGWGEGGNSTVQRARILPLRCAHILAQRSEVGDCLFRVCASCWGEVGDCLFRGAFICSERLAFFLRSVQAWAAPEVSLEKLLRPA